ncbi:hypothetical protein HYH02_013167 [Chlamydomonas schloesseri]|uniref:Uncharacterized protein n=1 Tax=Chlamydomonas schloesseri TaxID=2026947 RepID=A0A835SRM8_9CHLO|nr:hypothetical protein HYH02_013167 [Chlamydomonas schloesseri]|eukprot:KAG2431949.1 hypothetical protein HYH02_013167 [Chlamydomonas schloesseri]
MSSGRRPEEVFAEAREKVTFKTNRISYERRLLTERERAHRQLGARLQYGELNGRDMFSNQAHEEDTEEQGSSSDGSDQEGCGRNSSTDPLHRRRPTAGKVMANIPLADAPPPPPAAAAAAAVVSKQGAVNPTAMAASFGLLPSPKSPLEAAAAEDGAAGGSSSCGGEVSALYAPSSPTTSNGGAAPAAGTASAQRGSPIMDMNQLLVGRRGTSSSSRSMSAAQVWLLRSEISSGAVEPVAAAAADGAGTSTIAPPHSAALQRRPSSSYYGGRPGCGDVSFAGDGQSAIPSMQLSRGRSFSSSRGKSLITSGGAAGAGANMGSGALAGSALSFTAGGTGSAAGCALKPTPPVSLRATASFTLGTSGGTRLSTAAANWERARDAVAAAVAGSAPKVHSSLSPHMPTAQQAAPPPSMQQLLQRQRSFTRGRGSPDLSAVAAAPVAAGLVEQPSQPPQQQAAQTPSSQKPSQSQEAVATELADELRTHACLAEEDEEARDRLHMLRSGNSAAGEQVERSWRSFTMGLRGHTTTADGGCNSTLAGAGDADAAAATGGSSSSITADGGFAQFRSSSMRIRFVPEEDEAEPEPQEPQQPRGRYGAYPGRGRSGATSGGGRRSSTTSNLTLPPSFDRASASTDAGSAAPSVSSTPPPLLTQPPPSLYARGNAGRSLSGAAANLVTASAGGKDYAAGLSHATPAPPAAAVTLRARSFTAARRSSVLLAAAGSEVTPGFPQPPPQQPQ